MLKHLLPTLILLISILNASAQDKVSVTKKDAFNKVNKESVVSTIELTDFPNGLPVSAQEFLDDNKQFLTYSVTNGVLNLSVKIEKNEKVVYQKLFSQLGIHEVQIKKGKEKGTYSIEDFLNLYNL